MKKLWVFMIAMCFGQIGLAAQYYVMETVGQGVSPEDGYAASEMVRNSVANNSGDTIVDSQFDADFTLQPRLMKLGESYILTVEKRRDNETIYAAQLRAASITDLDNAARKATLAAINESQATRNVASENMATTPVAPSARDDRNTASTTPVPADSAEDQDMTAGQIQSQKGVEFMESIRSRGRWQFGIGPFIGRNVASDDLLYHLTAGYVWDVHPVAQLKVLGEANFGSDSGDSPNFFNAGMGANWFFMNNMTVGTAVTSPYLMADIGYGSAETPDDRDAAGFTIGTGLGFQFFRSSDRSLDVILRYAFIADEIAGEDGLPSVLGAKVAFSF